MVGRAWGAGRGRWGGRRHIAGEAALWPESIHPQNTECAREAVTCLPMGASDSKLSFKQGIFRLSEPKQIPADDVYWTGVCMHSAAVLVLPADHTRSSGNCPSRPKTSSPSSRPQTFAARVTTT